MEANEELIRRAPPPSEEMTAVINMELRSMWPFILQHCHGKFCTLSQGHNITAEKKERLYFVWCLRLQASEQPL